jgi:hypothetical protein
VGDVEPFVGLGVGAETASTTHRSRGSGTTTSWETWSWAETPGSTTASRFGWRSGLHHPLDSDITGVDRSLENDLMLSAGFMFRAPLRK